MVELYQFAFSHFCEKARWALDFKGIAYRPVNLLPGMHIKTVKKIAPRSHLPVLVNGASVVQDSPAIITYLDGMQAEPALTPLDAQELREALDWERYLDEEIGVTLRLWFYHHALPDRELALGFILEGAPWHRRLVFRLIFPGVRAAMRKYMNINAESAQHAQMRLLAALDRIDAALQKGNFLVGKRFTRADLCACALLSPFCLPDDDALTGRFPAAVVALRKQHKARPVFAWVRQIYAEYRRPSKSHQLSSA